MNAHSMAQRAYTQSNSATKTDRQSEYDTIARVTHEIIASSRTAKTDFPKLVKALHRNSQLWNILASDVASNGNVLPKALKAQIFYLAEFTRRHTAQVLGAKASPAPLVEVNTAMLRGLNDQRSTK